MPDIGYVADVEQQYGKQVKYAAYQTHKHVLELFMHLDLANCAMCSVFESSTD